MTNLTFPDYDLAVLLPCYNEGPSIAQVVLDFRRALPQARIYVYDNNSSDDTSEQAARAGAIVTSPLMQGARAMPLAIRFLISSTKRCLAATLMIFFQATACLRAALPKAFLLKARGLKLKLKCQSTPLS